MNEPPTTWDENSQAAAEAIKPTAATLRELVFRVIEQREPIAEWQIEQVLGLAGNTVRPRIWELMKAGSIERHAIKGFTPSKRACWRYVVTREVSRAAATVTRWGWECVDCHALGPEPPMATAADNYRQGPCTGCGNQHGLHRRVT